MYLRDLAEELIALRMLNADLKTDKKFPTASVLLAFLVMEFMNVNLSHHLATLGTTVVCLLPVFLITGETKS